MRMWAALDAAEEDLRREAAQLGSERMEPEPGSSEHGEGPCSVDNVLRQLTAFSLLDVACTFLDCSQGRNMSG